MKCKEYKEAFDIILASKDIKYHFTFDTKDKDIEYYSSEIQRKIIWIAFNLNHDIIFKQILSLLWEIIWKQL